MQEKKTLPVWAEVTRPDGSVEQVQVGVAVKAAQGGYELQLALTIGEPGARTKISPAGVPASTPGAAIGVMQDLESLATRARRILADPKKAKWHDSERSLLAAIEAELARKRLARAG